MTTAPGTRWPRPAQVIIGVDVGTTAAKVVGFGVGSPWRHVAVREYPLLEPVPGHRVQDPETVWAATASALSDVVAAAAGADVLALSVSTALHGLIGLDATMDPVTPLVTWADARATEVSRRLRAEGLGPELHQRSGTPVHPMSPLTKLVWFREHEPETWARARWWVGLKDYVLLRLTGTLVTELSSASGTGLLDMPRRAWSEASLAVAGVGADRLPDILPTTATLGLARATAARVGLPVNTPVVVGAADGPLGNLGTDAMAPGVVGLSLGTSGAARMIVDAPPAALDPSLFCYALTDTAWAVGGAVSNGGIVVRWAGQALAPDLRSLPDGPTADERLLELAASVPAGADGLIMLPYLLSERAPLWDPDLTGAFLGLRRRHTRGHLVRAAVEGVALQLTAIVERIDHIQPVTSVRATGGAFRSSLWREIMAATTGRPFHAVGAAEGSALGAAALGLHALGHAPVLADAPTLLRAPGAPDAEEVAVAPELVAAYAASRRLLPERIAALQAVASLFG